MAIFVLGAVASVIGFFVMLFVLFFLLRTAANVAPSACWSRCTARRDPIITLVANVTRAVVYGTGLTAIAQGLLVGVGFAIAGLPSPIVFGVLAAIMALLPAGGTAIISVPAVADLAFATAGVRRSSCSSGRVRLDLRQPHPADRDFPQPTVSTLIVFVGVVGGVAPLRSVRSAYHHRPGAADARLALVTYVDEMPDADAGEPPGRHRARRDRGGADTMRALTDVSALSGSTQRRAARSRLTAPSARSWCWPAPAAARPACSCTASPG